MRRVLRVAVIQFARERFEPERNFRRMREWVARVEEADVVFMPEAWVVATRIDEGRESELVAEYGVIAASRGFAVITGGLFVERGGRVRDVCHVIGSDGKLKGTAEKIFPSFPMGERNYCEAGDRLPVFEIGAAKAGILVCVDMLYPELCRSLARRGAEVIFNPSNIPEMRLPLWHSLVAARAAENTVYVVFASNTGTEYPDGRAVSGGSVVAAPWGDILIKGGRRERIVYAEIDLSQVAETRKRWRYLEDIGGVRVGKTGKVTRAKR
ncbi:MAG: carbon-nitrogen hydrolase family protein [bacterium]